MIVKMIIGVLLIGLGFSLIDSVEGIEIKKYKVINSDKVCGDKLCSEVDERIAKKGESSHNIKVCGDRLCSDFSENPKPFNKSSPFGQLKLGITIDLIQCKEGQEIIIKKTKQIPACVNLDNVKKLREKGWAISEKAQQEMFEEFIKNRLEGIDSSKTIHDFDATLTITPDEISNQRFLMFEGDGWNEHHVVRITISGDTFSDLLKIKTSDRGHLSMPWPIPDKAFGKKINIFATDSISEFEITIPISPSLVN
jgi:hypothetical protein